MCIPRPPESVCLSGCCRSFPFVLPRRLLHREQQLRCLVPGWLLMRLVSNFLETHSSFAGDTAVVWGLISGVLCLSYRPHYPRLGVPGASLTLPVELHLASSFNTVCFKFFRFMYMTQIFPLHANLVYVSADSSLSTEELSEM